MKLGINIFQMSFVKSCQAKSWPLKLGSYHQLDQARNIKYRLQSMERSGVT